MGLKMKIKLITLIIIKFAFNIELAFAGASADAMSTKVMGLASAGMNVAVGMQMGTICKTPGNQWACIMSTMSYVQAGASALSAFSAGETGSKLDASKIDYGNMSGFSDMSPINIGGKTYTGAELQELLASGQADLENLKKQGYVPQKDGSMKTPKGTASAGALSSGSGLMSEGILNAEEAELYDKALADMKNKISVVSMPNAGGGGGGSSRSPASYDYNSDFAMNFGLGGAKPEAAKTQGLSKNFGDTPIGTSTDDIFDMLHRNYRKKAEQSQFVQ